MRATEPLNVLGSQFGTVTSYGTQNMTGINKGFLSPASIYLSSIHYADSLNSSLKTFPNWQALYGPVTSRADQFTNILRYNFSSPLLQNPFTISGYGSRSGATQPFNAKDIVLLHDGYCSSTCAVFSDLMRRQGGVKSYAIGGLPQYRPMQPVGGTKGALLLPFTTLSRYINTVLGEFGTAADRAKWAAVLPTSKFAIKTSTPPSTNFRDALQPIKPGQYSDLPTQFVNETADCRLFYTPQMVGNVTAIWEMVAADAWGGANKCVTGNKVEAEQTIPGTPTAATGSPSRTPGAPTPTKSNSAERPRAHWGALIFAAVVVGAAVV